MLGLRLALLNSIKELRKLRAKERHPGKASAWAQMDTVLNDLLLTCRVLSGEKIPRIVDMKEEKECTQPTKSSVDVLPEPS